VDIGRELGDWKEAARLIIGLFEDPILVYGDDGS